MFEKIFKSRFSVVLDAIGSLKKSAELTDVSYEQVSRWRDGKSRPPLFAVAILCEKAGKSVDWVVGLDKSDGLDAVLLTNCLQVAEEHLTERGEKLDVKNKAMLIASLYSIQLNERQKNAEIQNKMATGQGKSVA